MFSDTSDPNIKFIIPSEDNFNKAFDGFPVSILNSIDNFEGQFWHLLTAWFTKYNKQIMFIFIKKIYNFAFKKTWQPISS